MDFLLRTNDLADYVASHLQTHMKHLRRHFIVYIEGLVYLLQHIPDVLPERVRVIDKTYVASVAF